MLRIATFILAIALADGAAQALADAQAAVQPARQTDWEGLYSDARAGRGREVQESALLQGVVFGGRRGFTVCSYAYAILRRVASLKGSPSNSNPTGTPSSVKPAGIAMAGRSVVALS